MNKIMFMLLTKEIKIIEKIINKKIYREVLKNIYITEKYIYATDGKMAIQLSREEMAGDAGDIENKKNYRVLSIQKVNSVLSEVIIEKIDLEYPDIEEIYNNYKIKLQEDLFFTLCKNSDELIISDIILNLYKKTENAYCYSFFEKLSILDTSWKAYNQGQDKAIYLISADNKYKVILLPFKLTE